MVSRLFSKYLFSNINNYWVLMRFAKYMKNEERGSTKKLNLLTCMNECQVRKEQFSSQSQTRGHDP